MQIAIWAFVASPPGLVVAELSDDSAAQMLICSRMPLALKMLIQSTDVGALCLCSSLSTEKLA